jgi:predicted secreted Zn-dependent protease
MNNQQQADQVAPINVVASICVCLLQERGLTGELARLVETLAAERHAHFHTKAGSNHERRAEMATWRECDNPNCREIKRMLALCASQEITVTPLMAQKAGTKRLMFENTPMGMRTFLEEKSLIVKPNVAIIS